MASRMGGACDTQELSFISKIKIILWEILTVEMFGTGFDSRPAFVNADWYLMQAGR